MNNTNAVQCQICKSTDFLQKEEKRIGRTTLGSAFEYTGLVYSCKNCGEEVKVDGDIEDSYDKAHRDSQIALQTKIIEELQAMGISMAYVERSLELPQRTLARLKHGRSCTAANLALLRIIRTIPWIVDVADQRFNKDYLTAKMASYLAEEFKKFRPADENLKGEAKSER